MSYYRGTLAEFNTWHDAAMVSEGIILPDGKIGYVKGVPAPDNQRTIAYSSTILHPANADDYIWFYGDYPDDNKTPMSEDDVIAAGWFPEVEE